VTADEAKAADETEDEAEAFAAQRRADAAIRQQVQSAGVFVTAKSMELARQRQR